MILHLCATAAMAFLAAPVVTKVVLDIIDGDPARHWAHRVVIIAILVPVVLTGIWA